jgi:DNA-binding response OmpR family regulator
MHILIIDDNQEIVAGLTKLLEDAHFTIHIAFTIKTAQSMMEKQIYDLIILDWIMPDGSGINFLKEQRGRYHDTTPILFLSSKKESSEKAQALDAGADNYIEKPFSNIELLAIIRALLRRDSKQKQSEFKIDKLYINLALREIKLEKKFIKLSKKEFELFEFLLLNNSIILTRYQIYKHLNRNFDTHYTSNIVDAHIKNLRKKLGYASSIVETIRGVGFKIKMTKE